MDYINSTLLHCHIIADNPFFYKHMDCMRHDHNNNLCIAMALIISHNCDAA